MKRILITDDDKFMADLYRHRFQTEGFAVSLASDGRSAIAALEEDPPDAVLLDLMLPDINGLEVLKFIRNHEKLAQLPVVVLSTSCAGILNMASQAGATRCLNKSDCTPSVLVKSLRDAIASAESAGVEAMPKVSAQVLLADDDRVIHRVLGFFLSQSGFAISSAFSGSQAIEMAEQNPPDVLVLDRMMPEVDGLAILRQWRAHPTLARIPVIMLTARASDEDRQTALAGGASDFLAKPFSPDELVAKISRLAHSH
jgi:DNA-binding response OmpR family regulator